MNPWRGCNNIHKYLCTQHRIPKYIKQIVIYIKGETDTNTELLRELNTPLISMERSSRQKINKEILALNKTLDQIDLIDTYSTFHLKINYRIHMFIKCTGNFPWARSQVRPQNKSQ